MKTIKITLLIALFSFSTVYTLFGQSPEAFKYQAVVRDGSGTLITSQAVGVQMTVLQGSPSGTIVYQETHAPTTNVYGLIDLEIGLGSVVSGTFSSINWGSGPYYMQTAIDVTGGSSYVILGTSQLLSVPYALHAKTAENSTPQTLSINGDTLFISDGNYLVMLGLSNLSDLIVLPTVQDRLDGGETPWKIIDSDVTLMDSLYGLTYQEGLIFYLDTASEWGFAAAPTEADPFARYWGCTSTDISPTYDALWAGRTNTNNITAGCLNTGIAAWYADNYVLGAYSDWYLPSIDELAEMYNVLHLNGKGNFLAQQYWSSTQGTTNGPNNYQYAKNINFGFYSKSESYKSQSKYIRAIRYFQ